MISDQRLLPKPKVVQRSCQHHQDDRVDLLAFRDRVYGASAVAERYQSPEGHRLKVAAPPARHRAASVHLAARRVPGAVKGAALLFRCSGGLADISSIFRVDNAAT